MSAANMYVGAKPVGNIDVDEAFLTAAYLNPSQTSAFQALQEIAESANAATDIDELILVPYAQTLKQQVFTRILEGKHGAALNMIYDALEGHKADYVFSTLSDFMREFEDMGLNDMANELRDVMSILPWSEFGLNVDFFNTGPNSVGQVDGPGEVRRLRHFIEAHFAKERFKPEQHVQPFLGMAYG